GVKLYFTRAKDFGFSKTPEETEKIWGDQVLEDMVRVIRTFRPNIVINGWGGVHGGHGHHQAAGLLTPIAVKRAADANAYPEQLKEGLAPWGAADNEIVILDLDRSDKPAGYVCHWVIYLHYGENPGVKSGSTRLGIIGRKEFR